MSKNISELSGRQGLSKNLFEELSLASAKLGSPSNEDLERIREEFLVGKSTVYGTVSFYDFLKPDNQGKKVYVCNGSACMVAGTQNNVINKLKVKYSEHEIGEMCCLGRCHENSAFHVNGQNYSGLDIDNVEDIISKKVSTLENYHVGSSGAAVLTSDYGDVSIYYNIFRIF